jgi:hypothetical protein
LPFSPLGLVLFRLALPFVGLLQLALMAALSWLARCGACCCCTRCGVPSQSTRDALSAVFNRTAYSRTVLALVMASFSTVATVVFDTIACVPGVCFPPRISRLLICCYLVTAGDKQVVFSLPASEIASIPRSPFCSLCALFLMCHSGMRDGTV